MEGFTCMRKLGEGTFGTVYRWEENESKSPVAIKQMKDLTPEVGVSVSCLREVAVLRHIDHPNILRIKDVITTTGPAINIVFECCDCNLKQYMNKNGLSADLRTRFLSHILAGISWSHEKQIIHRDLKPQNCLIVTNDRGDCNLKIGDWGLARAFPDSGRAYTHEVSTLWYRAPEILMGCAVYGYAVDMWSIGCILAEMINNTPIFAGDSEIGQLFCIFQVMGTPTEQIWSGVSFLKHYNIAHPKWAPVDFATKFSSSSDSEINILSHLLCYTPTKRVAARTALASLARFQKDPT